MKTRHETDYRNPLLSVVFCKKLCVYLPKPPCDFTFPTGPGMQVRWLITLRFVSLKASFIGGKKTLAWPTHILSSFSAHCLLIFLVLCLTHARSLLVLSSSLLVLFSFSPCSPLILCTFSLHVHCTFSACSSSLFALCDITQWLSGSKWGVNTNNRLFCGRAD